jgi:surface antigen
VFVKSSEVPATRDQKAARQVFEWRGHEVAGRLGSAIAAEPLQVRLQFAERQSHAFAWGSRTFVS